MHEHKDKTQASQKDEMRSFHFSKTPKISALAFDRDKNLFYLASDESIDEVLDGEGYHVVHANRNLSIQEEKKK